MNRAGGGIECLLWQDRITLSFEANHEEWRESVGELQDACGANEDDPTGDLWNGNGDNKCQDPVEWHEADKDPFALLALEDGELEDVTTDVVVKHLDTNVAVQHSRDHAGDEAQNVAKCLPAVWADTLVRRVEHVLALYGVAEATVHHVADVDQDLGADHTLPEVHRTAHLSHEFDEEGGTAEREDGVHQAVNIVYKTETWWRGGRDVDRWWVVDAVREQGGE